MSDTTKEQQDKDKKEKKEKKGKGGAVAAILLLLALLGGGVGIGINQGFFDGMMGRNNTQESQDSGKAQAPATTEAPQATTTEAKAATETTTEANPNEFRIVISEAVITIGTSTYADADTLKDYLLSTHKSEYTYVLVNSHSIKATYDSVKAVLDDLKYTYSEVTV